jgi:putative spermidine/putrescine transport system permease protein
MDVVSSPQWLDSAWLSLRIAVISAIMAVALSLSTAIALVRGDIRFKQGLYALILLPMIAPNIISAIAMYFFFAKVNYFSGAVAISVGHAVLAIPIATIIISSTLQGVDQRLENAAMTLGATRFTAFRRITMPLIAPGIASACIFAFLSSFDELLVALFMGDRGTQTLPVRIWSSVTFQLDPSIAAVSAILVLISVAALLAANFLTRKPRA